MKKITKRILLGTTVLLLILFLYRDKGFYNDTVVDWDLKRLPMLEPYQLFGPYGDSWDLTEESGPVKDLNLQSELVYHRLSVDSIAIYKNFNIMIVKDQFDIEQFVVCDCNTLRCYKFNSQVKALNKVKKKGAFNFKHPNDVYEVFKQNPSRETLLKAINRK
jgi:hypothetical protein